MSDQAPERWKSICLKHFAKARRGTTYIASELSENSISYPLYINMKSFRVGGGYNVNGDKFYTSPYAQTQLVKANDLLIANTDVTASCDILGAPICLPEKKLKKGVLFSHHVTALSLSKGINKFFLFYLFCLDANRVKMQSYGRGTTVKMLDSKEFSNLLLLIPPLPEQKKIASILTSVDEVIENTQKQIDKLQDLKKATMNELLTKGLGHTEFKDSELGRIPKSWEVKKLNELSDGRFGIVDGPFGSNLKTEHYKPYGVPVIQSGFVTTGNFKAESYVYVDEEKFQSEIRSSVKSGDLVMAKIGAQAGRCAIMPPNHPVGILAGNSLKISAKKDVLLTEYLYQLLTHLYSTGEIQNLRTETAQPAINIATLKQYKIAVPSVGEQKKIIKTLSSVDSQVHSLSQKLCQTQHLKKSLMQDLLTGKVRVKVN